MDTQTKAKPVLIQPIAGYVTQEVASMATGYSVKAIERKREEGVWVEGREWIRAPDGKPLISIEGFNKWAESGRASK